ncbi:DUF2997 domain-containing protein [Bacillus sp. FJAT-49711]|uniref:DUF2997 domain-containing protein n=1 Tax=Bacillus sp. FJAT-49711 TaxID=2833585 RepID=UPI001BCA4EE0|nr:DUF2997 domain-containing protein [Bacillus sp. FJAT-49711]MBS4218455.1 DUF2997 domain-containing protein [Bacillus sp. FJAT-49711]
MNDKKLTIKITEDGKIFAETIGIKGAECMEYIELLEELLDAQIVDSAYTAEYYETERRITLQNEQFIKEE